MLTVLPPAVLLVVALIYLPYAAYNLRRIHSAQRIIRRNHSLPSTTWNFQQTEFEENKKLFSHYLTLFCVFLWIAACCGLELSFGYHTRFMPLDYCILFIGSIGALGLYYGLKFDGETFSKKEATPGQVAHAILFFCSIFAFHWEAGTILAVCGGAGWLLSPQEPEKE